MKWFVKALRQYADFSGRARRTEFWMFTLFTILITIAIMVVFIGLGVTLQSEALFYLAIGLLVVVSLALMVPTWAVTARRLHDTGKSGWLQLIGVIPFGSIVVYVLCALEGTPGPNQYGPDPKATAEPGYPAAPGAFY